MQLLTVWKLVTVLHQPCEQVGKVAVAYPGVAFQPHDTQGGQLTERPHLQGRQRITLQFQFSERGEAEESLIAHHAQVRVVTQPEFDQAPGLPKRPLGDFGQIVAPQVEEHKSGRGAESSRFYV